MTRSEVLFEQASSVFVGGVNSPVRALKSMGRTPLFFKEAKGAHIMSEDGRSYIDYVLSFGPHLMGHTHPVIVEAATRALQSGIAFGAPTAQETQLAELIQYFFPSMQKMRFVNSGTEASMSAIRLARGATGRSLILKFEGCYHGHVDSLLVSAGSGGLTFGKPDSEGIPEGFTQSTAVLPFNDSDALSAFFKEYGPKLAGVIVEPVCGNMGVILPQPGFLETLRRLTTEYGAVLIFDEVMTGFRVSKTGAQGLYGIQPDLTCLGKVIGGGLPCGAYGGRKDLMAHVAPEGGVYQAGTLSGNAVVMAAGIAMLTAIKQDGVYEQAETNCAMLVSEMASCLKSLEMGYNIATIGTMFTLFFSEKMPCKLSEVQHCDFELFKAFYGGMLEEGVCIAPSQYEANFVSSAHTSVDIEATVSAMKKVLTLLKR